MFPLPVPNAGRLPHCRMRRIALTTRREAVTLFQGVPSSDLSDAEIESEEYQLYLDLKHEYDQDRANDWLAEHEWSDDG